MTLSSRSTVPRVIEIRTVWPGWASARADASAPFVITSWPSTAVMRSPVARTPSAGPLAKTLARRMPSGVFCPMIPRYGRSALPVSMMRAAVRRATAAGTAKPMPSLRPLSVAIWVATPTTRPDMSSSGPPELPGLRAASVWMVPVIAKPLGESIWRRRPETMPVDREPWRPKGLPMATTGSPTRGSPEANSSGVTSPAGPSSCSTATSTERSTPRRCAGTRRPPTDTSTVRASPTTWALVTMWPAVSTRNPDPVRSPASTDTTAGAAAR